MEAPTVTNKLSERVSARNVAQVKPLAEDPEYGRLVGLRAMIAEALADRERRLEIAAIEGELGRNPKKAVLCERLSKLKAIPPASSPATSLGNPQDNMPAEIGRALALARGSRVEFELDRAEEIKRLKQEQAVFATAVGCVDRMMDDRRAECSRIAAESVLDQHKEILCQIWQAAAAFSAAIDAERKLFADLLMKSFDGRPDILRRPALQSGMMLGSLLRSDSEISRFRRQLEQNGVI
jgi:hypothetical protein